MELLEKMNELEEKMVTLRSAYFVLKSVEEKYFDTIGDHEGFLAGLEALSYVSKHLGEDIENCDTALQGVYKEVFVQKKGQELAEDNGVINT